LAKTATKTGCHGSQKRDNLPLERACSREKRWRRQPRRAKRASRKNTAPGMTPPRASAASELGQDSYENRLPRFAEARQSPARESLQQGEKVEAATAASESSFAQKHSTGYDPAPRDALPIAWPRQLRKPAATVRRSATISR